MFKTHVRRMPNHDLYLIGGSSFPVMDPPPGSDQAFGVLYGRGAVENLVELHDQVHQIRSSKSLTDHGKAERIAQMRVEPFRKLVKIGNALEITRANTRHEEHKLFAVPPLDGPEAAIVDGEIRNWIRSLGPEERGKALEELRGAGNQRMVLALMRSPIRIGNEEKVAQLLWKDLIETTRAEEVGKVRYELETLDWGAQVTRRAAEEAAIMTALTPRQRLAILDQENAQHSMALFGFGDRYQADTLRRVNAQESPFDPRSPEYLPRLPRLDDRPPARSSDKVVEPSGIELPAVA